MEWKTRRVQHDSARLHHPSATRRVPCVQQNTLAALTLAGEKVLCASLAVVWLKSAVVHERSALNLHKKQIMAQCHAGSKRRVLGQQHKFQHTLLACRSLDHFLESTKPLLGHEVAV